MMQPFTIPSHIHVCQTDDGVLVLDLRRNKYFGLDRDTSDLLSLVVSGWPGFPVAAAEDKQTRACAIAEELLSQSVVAQAGAEIGTHRRLHAPQAERGLVDHPQTEPPRPTLGHVLTLAISSIAIAWLLHVRGLEHAVASIDRRSRLHAVNGTINSDQLIRLVRIYTHLRPFFFTARRKCLFDSLVLKQFLQRYDFHPFLVIGVATSPFRAHSWVQNGALVLNGDAEHAREHAPILVV